ncbi:MAG: phosphatase PAP2 family protein [Fidelibacterota bacterium]
MLEFLNTIDTKLFLFLNGLNTSFLDPIMWFITKKESWYPMYLIIIGFIIYRYKKRSLIIIPAIVILIALADQISVKLFKEVFERLRPSRVDELKDVIHLLHGKRGGKYGFVSSHAANSFAAATFLALLFKNKIVTYSLMAWAVIISYSRIYAGVHYPGDVICGALLGIVIGFLITRLREFSESKLLRKQ